MPVQSPKPLRVCLTCYDVLTKFKSQGIPSTALHGKHFPRLKLRTIDYRLFDLGDDLSLDSSGDDDDDDDENGDNLSRNNEVVDLLCSELVDSLNVGVFDISGDVLRRDSALNCANVPAKHFYTLFLIQLDVFF